MSQEVSRRCVQEVSQEDGAAGSRAGRTAAAPADPWPAPLARRALDALVRVPGSKSLTNRLLVLAALAETPTSLRSPLRARDTSLMAGALAALGAGVEDDGNDWRITPRPLTGPADVDCGLAGTVMRFVPPVAALARGPVRFDGDPAARRRPMRTVLDALRVLGVRIEDAGRGGLPFVVEGTGEVAGGRVVVDASGSSQFVSALLLSGPRFRRGVAVEHRGPPLPSLPHIAMTVQVLREAGVEVDDGTAHVWRIRPGGVSLPAEVAVEPDLSNAAPFLAAALVAGGRVTIPGWPEHTTQPGARLPELLAAMGATHERTGEGLTVTGTGRICGVDLDLRDVGELTPVLAGLAALADSPTTLRGIAHLRGHETDRLAALAAEINALGGDAEETSDGLRIRPRRLHGGTWHSYADHRMATTGALIGLAVPGVLVSDVATTSKTLPDFDRLWSGMVSGGS